MTVAGIRITVSPKILIFLHCGTDELSLVSLTNGAPLRIRNAYAEAAAFKAAALHQGIRIPITTFHLNDGIPMQGVKGKEYVNAQREQLSDEDFVTRCKKHQVRIDPILCGDPYEIKLRQREITGKSLPAPFFERGRLSIFQELTEDQGFRKELFALTINAKSMGGVYSTLHFTPHSLP